MTPHLTDEDVLLDYYGEGNDRERARVRAHLEGCAQCRQLDAELRAVLQAVETTPLTEPPSGFERQMWERIEPLLPVQPHGWRRWLSFVARRADASASAAARRPGPAFYESAVRATQSGGHPVGYAALATAAGLLIVASFSAGRLWERQPAAAPAPQIVDQEPAIDRAPAERLFRAEVEQHLERSQRMLVELVNADASLDPLAGDRARAADLVAAGRLYRRSAEEVGDDDVGVLLEDLERVLVEVANTPGSTGPDELLRLQQRIENQDLVFRLRVASREIRERNTGQVSW
jgi:hypothetical protein